MYFCQGGVIFVYIFLTFSRGMFVDIVQKKNLFFVY